MELSIIQLIQKEAELMKMVHTNLMVLAHEVCSKFKDKLEDEVEVADVYVAINAQYHDYCELFEKWFGKGNFDDMIFESAISFWFDDVDFGEDKLWKYFNELK